MAIREAKDTAKKQNRSARRRSVWLMRWQKSRSFNSTKFDQTVQCVFWLGIDPKQSDQIIRGAISLPHGIGKQKKVIAFCEEADAEAAKQAGAIEAGCDELIAKVDRRAGRISTWRLPQRRLWAR